ncbi:eukaryotic translation initiation factor 5B-like [Channa argus]|uniref:eukaryotic translation initiation factor 5B-like n=1 Tax=Channa argus TaxID=215402 RepID=UPI0029473CB2|nr:hypothetical protein Q8A73_023565 [Channa argus]
MTGVRKYLNWNDSDGIAEDISAESCHLVLKTSPPEYVQKISRYLESTAGQSTPDTVLICPVEEESDSGDSLFITQKLPEAVRTGRRHYYSSRSAPVSPRDLEENEEDTSSSASHEEFKTDKKRARKKFRPPKYIFPFLKGTKRKPTCTLSVQQNTSLHNATMGGFFKCVRELWQGYEREHDLGSSLPTLDKDGELISPLSEEQEEESEDEDIKVVEKKCFVAPSKAKCSQPWYTLPKRDSQVTQQRRTTRRRTTSQEKSLENQQEVLQKIQAKASLSRATLVSSDTDSSVDGDPSCGVLHEREMSVTSILTQTETPKTERHSTRETKKTLFREKIREDELCEDSDATFCEPPKLQSSPGDQTLRGSESDITVTETQTHAFHTDELSQTGQEEDEPESQSLLQGHTINGSVCNEIRVKKKKKKKSKGDHVRAEGKRHCQGEEEGLHAAPSVNMEVEETPSPPEYNRTQSPTLSDNNMLRQEERDVPDSTQRKKKRKKKSAVENIGQKVYGNLESDVRLEDSGLLVTCSLENTDENTEKKKTKKRKKNNVEGDEQLQSSEITAEPLHEDDEMQREKNQRKKKRKITVMEECEEVDCVGNTEAFQECSYKKKRPKHKNKQQSFSMKDDIDVSLSSDVNSFGHTGLSEKKKTKKRKDISEGVDVSYSPNKSNKVENADSSPKIVNGADDQDAGQIRKKKKKRDNMSETCSRNNAVEQSDIPGSVRKKKRTSSFLHADSEENKIQWHQQQSSSPAASRVWCEENPGVSSGDVETESAKNAEKIPVMGQKKKKKKRKTLTAQENVEDDHEPGFEEPNRTCWTAFSGSTDTGLKRKKNRKRTESDPNGQIGHYS